MSNLGFQVLSKISRVTSRACPKPRNACIFPPHQTTLWGSLLSPRSLPRVAVVTNLVLVLAGCFNYVPTDFTTVPVGEDVRLFVNPGDVPELSEIPVVGDLTPVVQGTLVGMEDDAVVVRVPVARRQQGFHTLSLGQSIRVPHDGIISAQLRVLDELKTVGVVSGTVAAATVLIFVGLEIINPVPTTPGDDPPEFLLNLFSIPIG